MRVDLDPELMHADVTQKCSRGGLEPRDPSFHEVRSHKLDRSAPKRAQTPMH